MRKLLLGGLLLGTLAVVPGAFAATNVGVSILIGNAPPPPRVVYVREPRWEYIPEERVYVVDDDQLPYDYFRYGAFVYIYSGGYWYRSASYRGPFVAIRREYVPRSIFYVSSDHYRWRHHPEWVPPGHRRQIVVAESRGEGRGHAYGHEKHGKHDD